MLTNKFISGILKTLDAGSVSSRNGDKLNMTNVKYYHLVNNTRRVKRGFNSLHYQLELYNDKGTRIACYPYKRSDGRLNLLAKVLESLVVTENNLADVVDMLKWEFLEIKKEVR